MTSRGIEETEGNMTKRKDETANCFHAVVVGKVQGVGFRVYTRESAQRHGVNGWVRNRPDGTVEVFAEGNEMDLTEFLTDLYRGPIMSHVEDIQLHWRHEDPEHDSFNIVR